MNSYYPTLKPVILPRLIQVKNASLRKYSKENLTNIEGRSNTENSVII